MTETELEDQSEKAAFSSHSGGWHCLKKSAFACVLHADVVL